MAAWIDNIITLGTLLLITWLFVRDPVAFVREWIVRPLWGADTADRMAARAAAREPEPEPEPEPDLKPKPGQADDPGEHVRIDCAARALAVGWAGEAAIIETLFDGVARGGGTRYQALRDAVRARAQAHGWSPPPRARTITISGKREIEL